MFIVSVVVTTKNEERNITKCLQSIKNQDFPSNDIEIIVVDNNSTDQTQKIARTFTKNVYNAGPERSAQRNFGAKKAHGKYLLYLDADMTLSPKVISSCVGVFENKKDVVALYIREIVSGKNFWSQVRRFERSFYDATVIDAVRCVRLEVFLRVGGFDETMSGPEDWDLDKKLKPLGALEYISTPLYHNESEFEFRSYLKKKKYYARSFNTYIKKWGKDDPDVKKQFSPYYRFFQVFIEKGKWKRLVQQPTLAMGMYILRFLVAIQFLTR